MATKGIVFGLFFDVSVGDFCQLRCRHEVSFVSAGLLKVFKNKRLLKIFIHALMSGRFDSQT